MPRTRPRPAGLPPRPQDLPPREGGWAWAESRYAELGWATIPVQGKKLPPRGVTGYSGQVTPEHLGTWRVTPRWRNANTAIRHEGTCALDVDHHDDKRGADTLAALAAHLGPLPPTWTSTARGPETPSRQHLYRVPADWEGVGTLPDLEVVQHKHRYSVVWPSRHPDTGERYTWYAPDGSPLSGPPALADLPVLPEAWLVGLADANREALGTALGWETPRSLSMTAGNHALRVAFDGTTEAWLAEHAGGWWSESVAHALRFVVVERQLRGHDAMVRLQVHLVRLAAEGHSGVPEALAKAETAWLATPHKPGEDPAREWSNALANAIKRYGGTK